MKPGTIVMYRIPEGFISAVPSGAIGEVLDIYTENIGCVVVMFPSYPSTHSTGAWSPQKKHLIPLSDPDIDVSETECDVLDKELEKV